MTKLIYEKNFDALKKLGFTTKLKYKKVESKGFMPLSIERIGQNRFSICHYYEQNGDLMRDPEITFDVLSHGDVNMIDVLTFQNDGIGLYQEVYTYDDDGKKVGVRLKLKKDLNKFFGDWLKNLKMQGFKMDEAKERE